ncbi:hypothetical protein UP10_31925 [Bradyrhizobium sp. LTSPM299]|nr:hypothetical protein UP10_31925 [Bradyrhizobium sp. LTSPM299]
MIPSLAAVSKAVFGENPAGIKLPAGFDADGLPHRASRPCRGRSRPGQGREGAAWTRFCAGLQVVLCRYRQLIRRELKGMIVSETWKT